MSVRPDVGLERLIHGLEQELLSAADEEFLDGARDLGMNPEMRGSAAFIGVKNLTPQLLAAMRLAYRARAASEEGQEEVGAAASALGDIPKRNVDA